MLDDEDLDFTILATGGGGGGGCIGAFVSLIIIAIVYFIVQSNHKECAERHCDPPKVSRLMNHTCLCVEEAKPNAW